jgi:hypothetical protein
MTTLSLSLSLSCAFVFARLCSSQSCDFAVLACGAPNVTCADNTLGDWNNANTLCASAFGAGYSLAAPTDEPTRLDLISRCSANTSQFIGLQRSRSNCSMWQDNNNQVTTFLPWRDTEPNNGDNTPCRMRLIEECVVTVGNMSKWNDLRCSTDYNYKVSCSVCARAMNRTASPSTTTATSTSNAAPRTVSSSSTTTLSTTSTLRMETETTTLTSLSLSPSLGMSPSSGGAGVVPDGPAPSPKPDIALIGGLVGGIVALLLILVVAALFFRNARRRQNRCTPTPRAEQSQVFQSSNSSSMIYGMTPTDNTATYDQPSDVRAGF